MEGKKILISLVLFLLCLNFISAPPPSTTIVTEFEKGYTIVEAEQPTLKAGENHTYYFFLYNTSTGVIIDNSSVNCSYFLADDKGNMVTYQSADYNLSGYWIIEVEGDKLEPAGFYSYGINCQNDFGGSLAGNLQVTKSGILLGVPDAIIQGIFLILFLGISAMFLFLTFQVNEPAPKIFFLLASFVFTIGYLAIAFLLGEEANIYGSVSNSMIYMMYAFGLIFIVVFAYILIKQTKAAVDSFQQNKGYDVDF